MQWVCLCVCVRKTMLRKSVSLGKTVCYRYKAVKCDDVVAAGLSQCVETIFEKRSGNKDKYRTQICFEKTMFGKKIRRKIQLLQRPS